MKNSWWYHKIFTNKKHLLETYKKKEYILQELEKYNNPWEFLQEHSSQTLAIYRILNSEDTSKMTKEVALELMDQIEKKDYGIYAVKDAKYLRNIHRLFWFGSVETLDISFVSKLKASSFSTIAKAEIVNKSLWNKLVKIITDKGGVSLVKEEAEFNKILRSNGLGNDWSIRINNRNGDLFLYYQGFFIKKLVVSDLDEHIELIKINNNQTYQNIVNTLRKGKYHELQR